MRGGYLGRLYWWFRSDILAQPWRMIILGVFVVLLVIPLSGVSLYVVRVLSLALIFALYAVSWDVLAGFTGQALGSCHGRFLYGGYGGGI